MIIIMIVIQVIITIIIHNDYEFQVTDKSLSVPENS